MSVIILKKHVAQCNSDDLNSFWAKIELYGKEEQVTLGFTQLDTFTSALGLFMEFVDSKKNV